MFHKHLCYQNQLDHVPRKVEIFLYQMFKCSYNGMSIFQEISRFYIFAFWINANQIPFWWTLWQHWIPPCHPTLKNPEGSSKIATVYSRKRDVTELDHCGVWIYKLDAIPVWTISSNPTNALLTSCVDLLFCLILSLKNS